ncbi:putative cupin superfamily protein [Chromohalobacter marismortui]|uniref:Putative cupin superfamily protein n=1 Tax=Chromohalobacter marismortui TaxID=42055 RepID=A0A4R7NTP3_9GAMM|nr:MULTISPECIES: cupin domain-containing protein [Chromohalobacter]MCI0509287.1 cupin domain-containing protein [Chromohalobacter sp.]MCI0593835.1 cupin domain-containing protein [Chromohalobacter sp.]TDU23820.1 putative cupin superfamily protein [Chromohalobacter marismortui]
MPRSPVIPLDQLVLERHTHGTHFEAAQAAFAAAAGATHLGARLVEVPPGKRAWPHHAHHANDELFVILAGTGELRWGENRHPVTSGDVVVCPAGGKESAHQLIASPDSPIPLRYLAVSSMREPDILEYPDSDKLGIFTGSAPGGDTDKHPLTRFMRHCDTVVYWEGETGDDTP